MLSCFSVQHQEKFILGSRVQKELLCNVCFSFYSSMKYVEIRGNRILRNQMSQAINTRNFPVVLFVFWLSIKICVELMGPKLKQKLMEIEATQNPPPTLQCPALLACFQFLGQLPLLFSQGIRHSVSLKYCLVTPWNLTQRSPPQGSLTSPSPRQVGVDRPGSLSFFLRDYITFTL